MHDTSYITSLNSKTLIPGIRMISSLLDHTDSPVYILGNLTDKDKARLPEAVTFIEVEDYPIIWKRIPHIEGRSDYTHRGFSRWELATLCADLFIDTEYIVRIDKDVILTSTWNESELFEKSYPCIPYMDSDLPVEFGSLVLLQKIKAMTRTVSIPTKGPYKQPLHTVQTWQKQALSHIWNNIPTSRLILKDILDSTLLNIDSFSLYGYAAYYSMFDIIKPSRYIKYETPAISPSGNVIKITGYKDWVSDSTYDELITRTVK